MNEKQQKAYDFIIEYKRTHDGNSPALDDIGGALGVSRQQANMYVRQLVELGKIETNGTRQIDAGGTWEPGQC